ncbi:hypothetical protein [Ruminococcus sp.]|jgi:adenine-specific DNA-methyltransferase|uniref:hypothetical protein n=1 Tax=Ruminococcus sp. TaxID=41978 RepID=UPI0025F622CD|nr:hypothetical protein [Ruminococcus sp.]
MKAFLGGSKTITKLKDEAIAAIDELCAARAHILVGDCFGADKLIQEYLTYINYTNVTVYVSGYKIRNNVGVFPVKYIECERLDGYEFYKQKDIAMADDADVGLMLWDGKTRGTEQNIIYLKSIGKPVRIISYCQEDGL